MSGLLELTCSLSAKILPSGSGKRMVYMLLDVTGGTDARRLPSNLGFVIDVSDSMRIRLVTDAQFAELLQSGQAQEVMTDGVPAYQVTSQAAELMRRLPRRIDFVKQALTAAGEHLRPSDSFALVAFAGRAERLVAVSPGRESYRLRQAANELEWLQLGDGTQLAEGIAAAFDEVQRQAGSGATTRLILLTDGHTQNVAECYAWAQKARQSGIHLTTMGIGAEFNEDLLIPLSDQTGGRAYYIEKPEHIPQVFREELGAAMSVGYQNVEIKLQMPRGVNLHRVYQVLPEISLFDPGPEMDGSYALLIGDYAPESPQTLLVELVFPGWAPGDYRLAQAMLAWDDPDEPGMRQSVRQEVMVRASRSATAQMDGRVMNIVEKVGAFKMGSVALEAAQNAAGPDLPAATLRLRQAATRLLDMGELPLGNGMLRQADALEQSGSLEPAMVKKLRYETRRLAQNAAIDQPAAINQPAAIDQPWEE